MQVRSRRTKNNPVLVGGAGVRQGRLSWRACAQKIVKGEVPETFKDKQPLPPGPERAGGRLGLVGNGAIEERLKKRRVLRRSGRAGGHHLGSSTSCTTLVGAGAAEGAIDAASNSSS